jgi:hypothetical protein
MRLTYTTAKVGTMDHIPFFKVSIEEAKEALQADVIKKPVTPPPKKDWIPGRLPAGLNSRELAAYTFKWLATIPANIRPNALARQYPRIANRIAEIWKRPLHCERYLDDLMLDLRGDRKGFPPDVAAEIAVLKVHFLRTAKTMHFGVWGNRIGVD